MGAGEDIVGVGEGLDPGPGSGVQPATSRPRTRTAPQLPTVRRLTTLPPPLWRATLYKTGGRCEPAARGDRVHHDEHHTSCVPVADHDPAVVLADLFPERVVMLSVPPGCCPRDTLLWKSQTMATLTPTPSALSTSGRALAPDLARGFMLLLIALANTPWCV